MGTVVTHRPGAAAVREDAQRRRRRRAPHVRAPRGCTRCVLQRHLRRSTSTATRTRTSRSTASSAALGAFPWRDGLDHGGAISSTINPVGSRRVVGARDPVALPLPRASSRTAAATAAGAAARRFVTGVGRPPDRAAFISSGGLVQSVTLGHRASPAAWPATGGTMWRRTTCAIRDGARRGPAAGRPRRSCARWRPAARPPPPKKFDNRLGRRRRVRGDALARAPATATRSAGRPSWSSQDVAGGRLLAEQARRALRRGPDRRAAAGRRRGDRARAATRCAPSASRRARAAAPADAGRAGGRDRHRRAARDRRAARGRGRHPPARVRRVRRRARRRVRELPRRQRRARAARCRRSTRRIFQDPSTQVDDGLVVRQYLCPSCAVALDTVVCPAGQEPEWDVLLEGAEEER